MVVKDAATWSLKRLAWAYGCAKRGSAEEAELRRALIEKAAALKEPRLAAVVRAYERGEPPSAPTPDAYQTCGAIWPGSVVAGYEGMGSRRCCEPLGHAGPHRSAFPSGKLIHWNP